LNFLEKLSSEVLLSEAKASKNAPNKNVARLLAQIEELDYALYLTFSKHTYWVPDLKGEDQSAAVEPHPDGEHIVFHYNPSAWENYDYGTILFLLLHELGHIIRDHHGRAAEHVKNAKYYHKIMNISMDTWINEDIASGKLGQYKYVPKPPFTCFSEKNHGNLYGSTVEWANKQIEQKTGTNPDLKYEGSKSAESFYDWLLATFKQYGLLDDNQDQDEGEAQLPEVGDIIRGPNNMYGEVTEVDEDNNTVRKIRKLTKEEAYRKVREKAGMEIPEAIQLDFYTIMGKRLFEQTEETVDWSAEDVVILQSSLGEEGDEGDGGDDGESPSNVEDIDPPQGEGESESDSGGDGSGSESGNSDEIKVGDIVQDMNSGKYGKITAIDGDDIWMDPVSDQELKDKGYKMVKRSSGEKEDDVVQIGALNWGAGVEKYL
jgi:hypothetical protein